MLYIIVVHIIVVSRLLSLASSGGPNHANVNMVDSLISINEEKSGAEHGADPYNPTYFLLHHPPGTTR